MKIPFMTSYLREKISQIIPVVFNRKNFIFSAVYFLAYNLFFWGFLREPLPRVPDMAVDLILLVLFAFFLPLICRTKSLRRLLFYYFLQILIVAAELTNFSLISRYDAERSIRYGFSFILCVMLLDTALTLICSSCSRLRKLPAILSAILQIASGKIFLAILIRNIRDGKKLELDTVVAVYQTDPAEALAYISLNPGLILAVIILLLFAAVSIWYYTKLPLFSVPQNKICRISAAAIGILLFFIAFSGIKSHVVKGKLRIFSLLVRGNYFRQELALFNQQAAERRLEPLNDEEKEKVHSTGSDGKFILVIGESNSRDYMSCYGYPRQTTPFLDSVKTDKRFIFFTNAYSNHVHTTEAIRYMLTEQNQYGNDRQTGVTLFDVLRYCRKQSNFISNQYLYDSLRSPVSAISQAADEVNYINSEMDFIMRKNRLDMDAVDFFTANQKNTGKSFTVIHLMSCHAPYQIRYPAGFADHLELDYEKATAYLDKVLEKLFRFAMSDPEIKGIIFIPDHAEDVEIGDHDSAGFTIDMTRIPMICYFSESWIAQNPELYKNLIRSQDKYFTNDLLFDLTLDIMGIKTSFNPPQLHLTADEYSLDFNNARTLHGRAKLDGSMLQQNTEN